MLRAILLGVLSLSAVACNSKAAAPKVVPGAVAGKVIEVSGTVAAKAGDKTRALRVGDSVTTDETIETGSDGRIVIELAHNHVAVDLGPHTQKRLADTLGWNEPVRNHNAKATDQDTAAAGRPAERSAVDTYATGGAIKRDEATADNDQDDQKQAPPERAIHRAEPAPMSPASAQPAPMSPASAQPSPPPPKPNNSPPRIQGARIDELKKGTGVDVTGSSSSASRSLEIAPQERAPAGGGGGGGGDPAQDATLLVTSHRAELVACLPKDQLTMSLVLHVGQNGVVSIEHAKLSKPVYDCVQRVVTKLSFARAKADVSLEIKR